MTCEHGYIGPCAICDGGSQVQEEDPVCPNCGNSCDELIDQGYGGAYCDNCNDTIPLTAAQRKAKADADLWDAFESGRPMPDDY